jgi:uncharacterized SAM-binding protein YcdF (DUF218 family)
MFIVGKLLWIVFAPANLLVLVLLGIWLAMPRRRAGAARRWLGAVVVLALLIACTPLAKLPLVLLENRFPRPALPDRVAGIVVLGGGISPAISLSRNEPAITLGAPRLLAFAELARRFPSARLVFTGGSGDIFHPNAKEAPIARQVMAQMGMDLARVMFEDRARDTYENAVFSRALANPGPDGAWLLITSAAHMPRAMGTFRAQGWHVVPWPVGYWTRGDVWSSWGFDFLGGLSALQAGLREWIGLGEYYVMGYTDSPIPGPQ